MTDSTEDKQTGEDQRYIKGKCKPWYNADNVPPPINETLLVYRPQVLEDDLTDKPIRTAKYDGEKFDCHHQPTHWQFIEKPLSWNKLLNERQEA